MSVGKSSDVGNIDKAAGDHAAQIQGGLLSAKDLHAHALWSPYQPAHQYSQCQRIFVILNDRKYLQYFCSQRNYKLWLILNATLADVTDASILIPQEDDIACRGQLPWLNGLTETNRFMAGICPGAWWQTYPPHALPALWHENNLRH